MIRAYATAKCLVGPHGASLTNMIFAPEGTRVLEVQTAMAWQLYATMAARLGMVYGFLPGDFKQDTVEITIAPEALTQTTLELLQPVLNADAADADAAVRISFDR